jgi:hypothetical protein
VLIQSTLFLAFHELRPSTYLAPGSSGSNHASVLSNDSASVVCAEVFQGSRRPNDTAGTSARPSEKQKNGPDRFLTSPDQFARKNFL